MDIIAWLDKNRPIKDGAGIAFAVGSAQSHKVTVELTGDVDETAERQKKDAETAAKRLARTKVFWRTPD